MPPQITTPPNPHVPRQTYDPSDPYGLASLSELLSMYNDPDLYSSLLASYDEGFYSSIMALIPTAYSYSIPGYTYPLPSATAQAAPGTSNSLARPTASDSNPVESLNQGGSASGSRSASEGGGLSKGAKIGIGVGVPLAVGFLVGIGIFLWCAGKRKGKKNGTTIVAPLQQHPPVQQQQPYATNAQGYIPGFPQPQQVPPPQYISPQAGNAHGMAYDGYAKEPVQGVVEMEQDYHFARPGAVEMDAAQQGRK